MVVSAAFILTNPLREFNLGTGDVLGRRVVPAEVPRMRFKVLDIVSDPGFGVLVFNVLAVWPLWRVFRRVGLPPTQALLVFVPVLGLVLVIVILAIRAWPLVPRLPKPPRKARRIVSERT